MEESMSENTRRDFLDAYTAADDNHNGQITPDRFISLMVALGVSGGVTTAQALLQKFSGDSPVVTTEEFINAVKHARVANTQIKRYKLMFQLFDKCGRGWVNQKSMELGLEEMGVPIEGEVKDKIDDMRHDEERISFCEFLRVQLKMPSTR